MGLGVSLGVGLVVSLAARWLGGRLDRARFGLREVRRLAAPLGLVGAGVSAAVWVAAAGEPVAILSKAIEVSLIVAVFWLAARGLDVMWATGHASARLRAQPAADTALLAGRTLGRVVLFLIAATVVAVRLGATAQLYLVLAGLGTALAFAARDPIRNAVAFVSMMLDPPFHIGDRVRLVAYRGGEEARGEVCQISLTATTIRTDRRTQVVVANVKIPELRVENLSAADRRRFELALPVSDQLSTEAIRAACDAVEDELRRSEHMARGRTPRVWLSGAGDELRIKATMWIRRNTDRRVAQRDLLLAIRARLDQHLRTEAS